MITMITRAGAQRRRVVAVSLLIAATSVVVATGALAQTFSAVTPTRIMLLGDSITRGRGSSWGQGFRLPLMQMMVVGRYTSDLVGSQNSGPPWLYDRNHDGYGGYGIDDISGVVAGELNAYRPDYVLLMIGSNDVQWGTNLNTAPDRLSALIDRITDTLPTANVIVASITPLANPTWDANARTYNAAIPGIVQTKAAAGKRVSFVDMYPLLTLNDLYDGVHPNDSGYDKLATAWAGKLASLRPAPPPVSARSCPCSIWASGDAPSVPEVSSTTAAEVGVKFRTEREGFITGVRFYKGPDNAGPHTASLWEAIADSTTYTDNSTTISGTLLSQGTVTSGSTSGWQEVAFSTPVPVSANKLYFASYYAPNGQYAADTGYFRDREIVNSPVRLPSQGALDGNGFIRIGSAGLPNLPSPQNDTNYWVDVVFIPAAPATPATVNATAVSSTQINVAWSGAADATEYRVERSPDQTTWLWVGTTSASVTTYSDTGLQAATTYFYRVVATNPIGNSPPSAVATATTKPLAPSSLTATAVSSARIDLVWSDVAGETGYRIERSTGGGNWAAIATSAADVTSYADTGLLSATTYSYRVVATNAVGDSPPSPAATATTQPPPPTAPPAPSSFTATAVSSTRIDLAWSDVAGETGYRIERSTGGSNNWAGVATTAANVTSYANAGLSAATSYSYRVVATNAVGDSPPSLVASATTNAAADTIAPTAPTGLKAAAAKGKVNLSWTGSTDTGGSGLVGYTLWRAPSATGSFTSVGTTAGTSYTTAGTSYSDASVTGNVDYWYRVTALDGAGNQSQNSNVVSARPK